MGEECWVAGGKRNEFVVMPLSQALGGNESAQDSSLGRGWGKIVSEGLEHLESEF